MLTTTGRGLAVACALALCAGTPSHTLVVSVTPAKALSDEPLRIEIAGAAPGARVTVTAQTQEFGLRFRSDAVLTARADGTASANASKLLWTMRPLGTFKPPAHHHHEPSLGAQSLVVLAGSGRQRARALIVRLAVDPRVRSVAVAGNGVVATFFTHPGRPRPAVIVLGGSEGGKPLEWAALVASHGLNALALAYFGVPGTQPALSRVPLERVEAALRWLQRRPDVTPSSIGVLGGSKGAELALLAAATFNEVHAVAAFAPSSVVFEGIGGGEPAQSSWMFRGKALPFANGSVPAAVESTIGSAIAQHLPVAFAPEYLARVERATNLEAASIPVEKIRGPVLLVSGDRDELWPSSYMANQIVKRLRSKGHRFGDVWLRYRDAGHPIGVPNAIAAYSSLARTPALTIALGGTPAANAQASAAAWPRAIAFLRAALCGREEC